jgi:uncharacterized protein YecE (DUF72 family)
MAIYVGVGGWVFEPWRDNFYPKGWPQKRELEYAATHLTAIEINGTYYGSQKPESFARWHDETPDDFVFTLKGPRFATNRRVLAEAGPSIEKFLTSGITLLKKKLGPLNWQFMATKKFDPEDFGAFLKLLPKRHDGVPLRHAVEVRHDSFKDPVFVEMCRKQGVAIIFAADSEFPTIGDVTADFVYARLMGAEAREKQGYKPGILKVWAERAEDWATGQSPKASLLITPPAPKKPRDVFLFFISGAKERNPAAAMAVIKALKK